MSVAGHQLDPTARSETIGDRVYQELRRAVMVGRFKPDQKIKIRTLATGMGTSLTPVREALRRLVAEGAFVGEPNRSVRMPPLTVQRVRELQDLRIVIEGYAARRAAEAIDPPAIERLRQLHLEILVARDNRDVQLDIAKLREFHFTLYAASKMPSLLSIIERHQGGPVGLETLAAALAEDTDAIEDIYEPFLMQIGFLNRTPRGRVATQLAYDHLGIKPNRRQQTSLF